MFLKSNNDYLEETLLKKNNTMYGKWHYVILREREKNSFNTPKVLVKSHNLFTYKVEGIYTCYMTFDLYLQCDK